MDVSPRIDYDDGVAVVTLPWPERRNALAPADAREIAAAVEGPAIGLGMDLALCCDMRLVGAGGFLQQGWAAAGLISGTGGAALIERLAPGRGWRLLADQARLD